MKYNNDEHRIPGERQLAQGRQRLEGPRLNEKIIELFRDVYDECVTNEAEARVLDAIIVHKVIKPLLDPTAGDEDPVPPMTLKTLSQVFQISQAGAKKIVDKAVAKLSRASVRKGGKKLDEEALKNLGKLRIKNAKQKTSQAKAPRGGANKSDRFTGGGFAPSDIAGI